MTKQTLLEEYHALLEEKGMARMDGVNAGSRKEVLMQAIDSLRCPDETMLEYLTMVKHKYPGIHRAMLKAGGFLTHPHNRGYAYRIAQGMLRDDGVSAETEQGVRERGGGDPPEPGTTGIIEKRIAEMSEAERCTARLRSEALHAHDCVSRAHAFQIFQQMQECSEHFQRLAIFDAMMGRNPLSHQQAEALNGQDYPLRALLDAYRALGGQVVDAALLDAAIDAVTGQHLAAQQTAGPNSGPAL